jgi:hypothetical protein
MASKFDPKSITVENFFRYRGWEQSEMTGWRTSASQLPCYARASSCQFETLIVSSISRSGQSVVHSTTGLSLGDAGECLIVVVNQRAGPNVTFHFRSWADCLIVIKSTEATGFNLAFDLQACAGSLIVVCG